MNDRQFEQKKKELYDEMRANGYGWINGKWIKPPEECSLRSEELYCISMINSILCYSCEGYDDAEKVMEHEENSYHNYLEDYVRQFGRDKVIALIQEQIDSIDYIKHNVHTDSEGVSYNSIIWKEELNC